MQSVSLWVEYLDFVEDQDVNVAQCSEEGLTKMRNLCERALSAAGLHVTEGAKIWEAYREFEQAVLLAFGDTNEEVFLDVFRTVLCPFFATGKRDHEFNFPFKISRSRQSKLIVYEVCFIASSKSR